MKQNTVTTWGLALLAAVTLFTALPTTTSAASKEDEERAEISDLARVAA